MRRGHAHQRVLVELDRSGQDVDGELAADRGGHRHHLAGQPVGLGGRQTSTGEALGERGGLRWGEPVQRHLSEPAPLPGAGQQVKQLGCVEVLCAGGRCHQQTRLRPGPEQVVQQLAGVPVGLRDVVDDQQDGPRRGQHRRGNGVEEPQALLVLGQRTRSR
jgi:hypothetical protein